MKIASSPSSPAKPTVIICPGNGCSNVRRSSWYGDLHGELTARNIPCICEDFPDPHRARREIWIPHIRKLAERGSDSGDGSSDSSSNVILVGHSSGAQAALRYAELYPIRAAILVAATYSDLGDAGERASGYYPQQRRDDDRDISNPYDFESMKANCPEWHQFHSDDDPFIALHEAERIRDGLGIGDTDRYHMLPGRLHFFEPFPELIEVLEMLF